MIRWSACTESVDKGEDFGERVMEGRKVKIGDGAMDHNIQGHGKEGE